MRAGTKYSRAYFAFGASTLRKESDPPIIPWIIQSRSSRAAVEPLRNCAVKSPAGDARSRGKRRITMIVSFVARRRTCEPRTCIFRVVADSISTAYPPLAIADRPQTLRGDETKPATAAPSTADGNNIKGGGNSPSHPTPRRPSCRGRGYKTKSYTRDIISRRGRAFREGRRNGPGNNSKVPRGAACAAASPAPLPSLPLLPLPRRCSSKKISRKSRLCACLSVIISRCIANAMQTSRRWCAVKARFSHTYDLGSRDEGGENLVGIAVKRGTESGACINERRVILFLRDQ